MSYKTSLTLSEELEIETVDKIMQNVEQDLTKPIKHVPSSIIFEDS